MELIEFAGYFFGFWLFLFSKKFRKYVINDWQTSGMLGKSLILFGTVSSVFCGVLVPFWIIQGIVTG
ncbi:MAG: hypothetical protein GY870_03995 [archaeon]|nr:hypothetical protein [archaeon]